MTKEKDPKVTKSIRTVLSFVAILLIAAGALVISRILFLQNPLNSIITQTTNLPQNEPTNINGVSTELSSSGFVWGEDIQNENDQEFERPWVVVKFSSQTVVGQIIDTEFVSVYELPATAENLRLFTTGKFLYTIPSTNVANAKLIAGDSTESITVAALNKDEEFIDAYFEASTKTFYYLVRKGNQVNLFSIVPGRAAIELYSFGLSEMDRILSIDDVNQLVYLALDPNLTRCEVLGLESKSVQETFCEIIGVDQQVNYVVSSFKADIDSVATIAEVKANSGSERDIVESETGILYTDAARFKKLMVFIENELVEEEQLVFAIPNKVLLMDLTIEDVVAEFEIPDAEVQKLIPESIGSAFAIVKTGNISSLLRLIEGEEPEEVIIAGCEIGCDLDFYSLAVMLYEAP